MISKQLERIEKKLEQLPGWLGSNWSIALSFAILTVLILGKVLLLRHTTFFVNPDNVDQFYAWYQKLAVSMHHGYLPVWNANAFAGQSFAGELQPGIFYPINWIWMLVFGSASGISENPLNWLVALHFWIGAFGCYLLLKQLGARKWAAFLGGLTFAFSGTVAFRSINQTVIFFGLCWVPYGVYFLLKEHATGQRWWLIACGVALGMPLLAGHIDPFFFSFMAVIMVELAYVRRHFTSLHKLWDVVLPSIKRLVAAAIIAVVVASPQLIVSASYLGNSYRNQADGFVGPGQKTDYAEFAKGFNLNMHDFFDLVDPTTYPISDGNDIFIGLAPLFVILVGWYLAAGKIRKTEQWKRHSFLVTSMLVFSVTAMLGYITWFAVILYKLPVVYEIRQLGRYSIFFDLGLVIMLAIILPVVADLQLTKRQRRNMFFVGAFMFIESAYLLALRNHIFGTHFALQVMLLSLTVLLLVFVPHPTSRKAALTVLVVVTAGVNTLWFLPKIDATTETTLRYTAMPTKLVSVLESTNGRYRVEIQNNAIPVNTGAVYSVQTIGGYGATIYAPFYNFMYKSGLPASFRDDLLGVRLEASTTAPVGSTVLYKDRYASVYSRPSALPKFFTTDKQGSVNRADYHGLVVATTHYDDHTQSFRVQVPKTGQVILSEIYYPGWNATVNGKAVQISDYAVGRYPLFKAMQLPKGTDTVTLTYKPFGVF